jgi:hypothetical protein
VIAAALATTVGAGPAMAGSVFLNNVNIDGLTSQKFEKATVRIDEQGNVYIDAPAYRVEVQSAAPSAPVATAPQGPAPQATLTTIPATGTGSTSPVTVVGQPGTVDAAPAVATLPGTSPVAPAVEAPATPSEPVITKRYWLVTEQNAPGMTQYDVDVYVNSRWVRRLRGEDPQVITEMTKLLQPGTNTVLLRAHKNVQGQRKSYSPGQYFRVILGSGNVGGDQVLIDRPLVNFERTAAQTDDASQEFTFVTQ